MPWRRLGGGGWGRLTCARLGWVEGKGAGAARQEADLRSRQPHSSSMVLGSQGTVSPKSQMPELCSSFFHCLGHSSARM